MLELDGYRIAEAIPVGPRFALFRARREADDTAVLIRTPTATVPSRRDLVALRHEFEITSRLDIPRCAACTRVARDARPRLSGPARSGRRPAARVATGSGRGRRLPHGRAAGRGDGPRPRGRPDPQGADARARSGRCGHLGREPDRLRHCGAARARTRLRACSQPSRGDARLHGARTDRADEPDGRPAQRSVRARRRAVRAVRRPAAVHGDGPARAGACTRGACADAATRVGRGTPACVVRRCRAAAGEAGGGPLPDGARPGRRPRGDRGAAGVRRIAGGLRPRRARCVGPAADSGEAVRARSGGRAAARRLRARGGGQLRGGARRRLPGHRQVRADRRGQPPRSQRTGAGSSPESSTSSGEARRTARCCRRCAAWSAGCSASPRQSLPAGASSCRSRSGRTAA
jgi:hypothetical protein